MNARSVLSPLLPPGPSPMAIAAAMALVATKVPIITNVIGQGVDEALLRQYTLSKETMIEAMRDECAQILARLRYRDQPPYETAITAYAIRGFEAAGYTSLSPYLVDAATASTPEAALEQADEFLPALGLSEDAANAIVTRLVSLKEILTAAPVG